ncbi:restriction endonuclease [Aquimarina megaterium]|uniref:restriction endonuclease n=1 Tax=Aquimarina megaterium TaxID=1443666 RepID=UPI0004BAFA6B|nr:restriction endonuclease [Aquimarina megaterium]
MKEKDFMIWMVRAGSGGYLIDEFLNEGIVAIGWDDMGRFPKNIEYDELKELLVNTYEDWTSGKIAQTAGQIWRFLNEFEFGDKVVTYDSNAREYYVGEIVSNYKYSKKFEHRHYRKVRWDDTPVDRDLLTVTSKNTLGSILTIFEISMDIWDELLSAHPAYISEEKFRELEELSKKKEELMGLQDLKEEAVSKSFEFIKDIISNLSWSETEELVAGVLRAMGYKTRMTSKGGDLGSDIIASPDGLEMVEPIIKAEVKHKVKSKEKIGAPDIRSFVGGLRNSTKGLYVSTTGFSKEAMYEAERANFQITLVDLDRLVGLIVEYYEVLDSESRALIPLRKIYWPI